MMKKWDIIPMKERMIMTVKELIEALSRCNQDLSVVAYDGDFGGMDTIEYVDQDEYEDPSDFEPHEAVILSFNH